MMDQMFKIDDDFLTSLGLGDLSADEKQDILDNIQETLESRVGIKLVQNLSNEQIEEFNNILSVGDPETVSAWMENNIPNHREIVALELDEVVAQIKTNNLAFVKSL